MILQRRIIDDTWSVSYYTIGKSLLQLEIVIYGCVNLPAVAIEEDNSYPYSLKTAQ